MEDFSEKELIRVRLRCLDLMKSFFEAEPDAEKLSRWRGIFSALARERIAPHFDGAVADICRMLKEKSLHELQHEYYELFINPFSGSSVPAMASCYLDGRGFGRTLVSLRGFLQEAGLKREEGVAASEDSLPILLDILASLIEEQKVADSHRVRQLQGRLLTGYLAPFAREFSEAIDRIDTAVFYASCSRLLCGYLDLEKGLAPVS